MYIWSTNRLKAAGNQKHQEIPDQEMNCSLYCTLRILQDSRDRTLKLAIFLCPQQLAGSLKDMWTFTTTPKSRKYYIMWVPTHHVMPNGLISRLTARCGSFCGGKSGTGTDESFEMDVLGLTSLNPNYWMVQIWTLIQKYGKDIWHMTLCPRLTLISGNKLTWVLWILGFVAYPKTPYAH